VDDGNAAKTGELHHSRETKKLGTAFLQKDCKPVSRVHGGSLARFLHEKWGRFLGLFLPQVSVLYCFGRDRWTRPNNRAVRAGAMASRNRMCFTCCEGSMYAAEITTLAPHRAKNNRE